MPKLWFRARRPEEGQGYSVASAEGLLAAAAFIVIATAALTLPWLLDRGGPTGFAVGAVLFLLTLGGLLLVVRRHSDWRG